jgi:endonuclease YncB( thermonuclease family)
MSHPFLFVVMLQAIKLVSSLKLRKTGGKVGVIPVESDHSNRSVAEVSILPRPDQPEKCIQEEWLTAGMAESYSQNVNRCWKGENHRTAEAIAQNNKSGEWSGQPLQRPWEFHQRMQEHYDSY